MRKDGKIDYIEFPGADLAATKGFYGQAFGWTFTDYGPAYAAFDNGGGAGGGEPQGRAGPRHGRRLVRRRDRQAGAVHPDAGADAAGPDGGNLRLGHHLRAARPDRLAEGLRRLPDRARHLR